VGLTNIYCSYGKRLIFTLLKSLYINSPFTFLKKMARLGLVGATLSGKVGIGNNIQPQNTPPVRCPMFNVIDIAAGDGHFVFYKAMEL
jgi:hypothetical protein